MVNCSTLRPAALAPGHEGLMIGLSPPIAKMPLSAQAELAAVTVIAKLPDALAAQVMAGPRGRRKTTKLCKRRMVIILTASRRL